MNCCFFVIFCMDVSLSSSSHFPRHQRWPSPDHTCTMSCCLGSLSPKTMLVPCGLNLEVPSLGKFLDGPSWAWKCTSKAAWISILPSHWLRRDSISSCSECPDLHSIFTLKLVLCLGRALQMKKRPLWNRLDLKPSVCKTLHRLKVLVKG
jgi:hypothetical protein